MGIGISCPKIKSLSQRFQPIQIARIMFDVYSHSIIFYTLNSNSTLCQHVKAHSPFMCIHNYGQEQRLVGLLHFSKKSHPKMKHNKLTEMCLRKHNELKLHVTRKPDRCSIHPVHGLNIFVPILPPSLIPYIAMPLVGSTMQHVWFNRTCRLT